MRKVIAYELLSLDGVAERPDEFFTDFDEVMEENLERVISTQDTVLLGRRTFDEWARFWPPSDIEPFASFINPVEKFVATSSTLDPVWTNASRIGEDLNAFVVALKKQSGGDIGVHGSIALTQALLRWGLIDELRLVIAPSLQFRGRKLFDEGLPTRLTLLRHAISPAGYVLLDYKVTI